jgi:hypothetical protein
VVRDLGREVLVNSGVKRGNLVILNPAVDLAEGAKVRTRQGPSQTSWPAPVVLKFGAKTFQSSDFKAVNSITKSRVWKAHSSNLENRRMPWDSFGKGREHSRSQQSQWWLWVRL